jgi:hypothetical protein
MKAPYILIIDSEAPVTRPRDRGRMSSNRKKRFGGMDDLSKYLGYGLAVCLLSFDEAR